MQITRRKVDNVNKPSADEEPEEIEKFELPKEEVAATRRGLSPPSIHLDEC